MDAHESGTPVAPDLGTSGALIARRQAEVAYGDIRPPTEPAAVGDGRGASRRRRAELGTSQGRDQAHGGDQHIIPRRRVKPG